MTPEISLLGQVSTQITIIIHFISLRYNHGGTGSRVECDSVYVLIVQLDTEHSDPHASQPQVSGKPPPL